MKTFINTTRRTETDVEHEVSVALFTVISVSASLIGLWAVACLIGGLVNNGVLPMIRGYITAVTGY
jgi:hypothetical protein